MPEIREEVDKVIEDWAKDERALSTEKVFEMSKGDNAGLPGGIDQVQVGLGWTTSGSMDIDSSVVMLGDKAAVRDTVYYGKETSSCGGVRHQGDNQTGDGDGDDEVIKVLLKGIDPEVRELYVTVNCYNGSFEAVSDAYVRMVDSVSGKELCRYKLDASVKTDGVVFCKIYRSPNGKSWGIEALGEACSGKTAKSSGTEDVVAGLGKDSKAGRGPPKEMVKMVRRLSSKNGNGGGGDGGGGGCCTIS